MLRLISGLTRGDKIRNKYFVRGVISVATRWYRQDERKMEMEAVRVVMKMNVEGKKGRENQNRWLDTTKNDMRLAGMCLGKVEDCDK